MKNLLNPVFQLQARMLQQVRHQVQVKLNLTQAVLLNLQLQALHHPAAVQAQVVLLAALMLLHHLPKRLVLKQPWKWMSILIRSNQKSLP